MTNAHQIPGNAVEPTGTDIDKVAKGLLRGLQLLPGVDAQGQPMTAGFMSALVGPPSSVAVIEAGATAASKWWSTGIALSGGAVVLRITSVWDQLGKDGPWNQPFALLAIAVILAAMAVGISYLLGSDVRGRADAMVATIEARRDVANALLMEAGRAYGATQEAKERPAAAPGERTLPPMALGQPIPVMNGDELGNDEADWNAIAERQSDGNIEYLLVKANRSVWMPSNKVRFQP